ncbi:MAG TPA: AtpZ/AtpI family protein [Stellaceae bacterium]|jgi:ATP synthase protein I|nr:AtpZ/AtpI family protein [Stellaceae bacterium]
MPVSANGSPMNDSDPRASLRDLETGLEKARRERESAATARRGGDIGQSGRDALGLAFRISLELVVAVIVGAGIGWALDRWLGTRPWGMIILFFLGIAAGLVNVYRAITGMGMAIGYRQRGAPPAQGTGFDEDDED